MIAFISGLIVAGDLVATLFFLRFWRETRDRLFALFALAFGLLALQRAALTLAELSETVSLLLYGLRALAFLAIIYAIVDKNRAS